MKKGKKLSMDFKQHLTDEEMKVVKGGTMFQCYCGFVGGPYESYKFYVDASGIEDALQQAGTICQGAGATCTGDY